MAIASQKRLVADPSIGVMDLMKVLRVWMAQNTKQDLLVAVSCPGSCQWSWKTAPNPTWMKQVHDLMKEFFEKVAPNGVLPSAKLKAAISKMCADAKINKSKMHDQDFADRCDNVIRIVMAQFRTVKKSMEEYQRLMRKATPEEKDAIDSALSVLKVSIEDAAVQDAIPPDEPSTSLAIVPYKAWGGHASSSSSDSVNIFKNILSKQDSSPSKIPMEQKTVSNAAEKGEAADPFATMMEKTKNVFLQGGLCVPADESTASETASAPSPKVKKPKIVSRSGSNSANKKDAAAPKAGLGLTEDDLEIMEEALGQEAPSSKPKKIKKPAASGKAKAKSKASPKKKTKKKGDLKTTFRHRATSSAWASAKRRALAMGQSPKSARQAGRAAAMEVSRQIDSGVLQEK